MLPFIQFVHLFFVVTTIGFYFSAFVYLVINFKNQNRVFFRQALRASLVADGLFFFMLMGLLITGTLLVVLHGISFTTPWIIVAYHLLALVALLTLVLFAIKLKQYRLALSIPFQHKKLFYCLNACIFVLLFFAVHDAVMQSTWFYFSGK